MVSFFIFKCYHLELLSVSTVIILVNALLKIDILVPACVYFFPENFM